MTKVAVFIETTDSEVKVAHLGVLTAAQGGGNEVHVFISGTDGAAYKEQLGKYGAARIVTITANGDGLHGNPDLRARAIIAALEEYDIPVLLSLGTSTGNDILARVAARLKAPLAVDCLSVDCSAHIVRKPYFSGKTIATLKMSGSHLICTLRPNTLEPLEAPIDAQLVSFDAVVGDTRDLAINEIKKSSSGKVDLLEANVIVSGGRPMGSSENFKMLDQCAAAMNGAIGASRVAVDGGFATHSMQVGQTGKTVNPKLYIACGISGSVQHFAGMKTSKIIVAINSDKDAPIFNKCDYGIVGDIFEVVPALTAELSKK